MSEQVIDERVVSMKFDNKEFEKNATQSLSTIQKLKQALNFKDSAKGLDEIEKASKKIDLSHIGDSVDAIKQKFNGWEVAARAAITNVTNSAVNAAKRMVSSVTIDPVKTGLGVYEQKLNSVQTMINNSGKSLAEVTDVLDELNTYSDKTIFSLNDMTTALGKFTAQGVDIKKAATIIKGAANEAATMGAGSAEFSRFIYNLTQAYGMGKMTTIDWKSLENAGVAGREFKEQLIESAKVLGTIDEKGMYKGQLVTTANLREFLKDGIITAEVMTDTFEKYAGVKEGFEDFGKKALSAAQDVKTFHQLMDVLAESVASTWSQSFGYIIGDFYEAKALWTNVSKIFDQTVGKMNERRNDLLKAWHDGFIDPAVEATMSYKELESAMQSGDFVKQNTLSGRTMLLDSLANVLQSILQIIKPIKEAFREFFPATTAKNLWQVTYNLREFTSHLKLSSGALKEIKDAARGIFALMKFGRTLIKDVLGALIPATKEVDSLAVIIIKIAGLLGRTIVKVIETIRASEGYKNALNGIGYAASLVIKIVGTLVKVLFALGKRVKETNALQKAFSFLGSAIEVVVNLLSRLAPAAVVVFKVVGSAIAGLLMLIGKGLEVVEGFFGNLFGGKKSGDKSGQNIVAGIAQGVEKNVGQADKAMDGLAKGMIDTFAKDIDSHSPSLVFAAFGAMIIAGLVIGISKSAGLLSESENKILQFVGRIGQGIADIAGNIKKYVFEAKEDSSSIVTHMQNAETQVTENSEGLLNRIGNALRNFVGTLKSFNIASIVVIGVIGVLLYNITRIISTIYHIGDAAKNGMSAIKKISKGFENLTKAFRSMHNPLVETLKGVAICVVGIAASLWLLSTLKDTGKLAPALASLVITFAAIVGIITVASSIVHKKDLAKDLRNMAMMVLAISGSFVLLGIAFEQILNSIKEEKWENIGSAFAVLGVLAIILTGVGIAINRFAKKGSVSSMLAMVIFIFGLTKVINALNELIAVSKGLGETDSQSLWVNVILPVLAIMTGMALIGAGFKNVKMGSALMVLVLIQGLKQILTAIKDLTITIDPGLLAWLNKETTTLHDVLVALGLGLLAAAAIFLILNGDKINALTTGLLKVTFAIAGLALVAKLIQALKINATDISTLEDIAWIVGGLLVVVGIISKFGDKKAITSISKIIKSLVLVVLSMAALTLVMKNAKWDDVNKSMAMLGEVILGLYLLVLGISHVKGTVKTGPILALVGGIVAIAGVMILMTTIKDWNAMAHAMQAMIVIMGGLAVCVAAMALVKNVPFGPILSLVGAILVLSGALIILANNQIDTERTMVAALALGLCLLALAGVFAAMHGLKTENVGPAIVGVVAVLAIGAMLWLLAQYDWENVLNSALGMGAALLALSIGLRIISGAKATNAIAGALALVIAATSLLIIAQALKAFIGIDKRQVESSATALMVLTAALGLLSLIGLKSLAGAGALVIGAFAIIVLAEALKKLKEFITPDLVESYATTIMVLAAALGLLGLIGTGVLIASAGLIITAYALKILAEALAILDEAQSGGWDLAGLAIGLAAIGIAGIICAPGAMGLLIAAAALRILAPALVTMGEAYKTFTGINLAGLAVGLMFMGFAGVILGVGSTGLMLGGVGLSAVAGALYLMSLVNITPRKIDDIAYGIMEFAKAGIIGVLGGVGLIELAFGISYICSSIKKLAQTSVELVEIDFARLAEDAVTMGRNIVQGLEKGMIEDLEDLSKTTLLMASVVENTFRNKMGIHSRSRLFIALGQWILKGLGFGVADETLNSGIADTMKAVADNLLNGFTSELGLGFDKIGELFKGGIFGSSALEDELKEQKKIYDRLLEGKKEFYKAYTDPGARASYERKIGTAASKIAALEAQIAQNSLSNMFSNSIGLDFSSIGEQFNSLFGEDTFGGLEDLKSLFEDLDFDVTDVTASLGKMDIAMDNVDMSNTELTSNMAKSIDVFSEYDRSLTMTTADIKKNLLDNLIGEEEFATNINNLIAARFDPELINQIIEKGKSEGNKIAAALLGGFNAEGKTFVDEYNSWFAQSKTASAKTQFLKEVNDQIKEGITTAEKAGVVLKDDYQYMNGTFNRVNSAWSRSNFGWTDAVEEATDNGMAALHNQRDQMDKYLEEQEAAAKRNATNESNAEVVNQAFADISQEIQSAIQKYLPATEFVQIGKNICIGLASGIWGFMNLTTMATQMSARELIRAFQQETGIASPSKVFYQFGNYIQEGLANGISDNNDATKSTKEMGDSLLEQFRTVLDQIMTIMETDDTWQPTIRPVVDFNNIYAGASEAQNAFNGLRVGAQVTAAANDIQATRAAMYGTPTLAGMSRDEFREFLTGFANTIVNGVNNGENTVEVNVNLEGDAAGIFNLVREQNTEYKKTSGGRSALA